MLAVAGTVTALVLLLGFKTNPTGTLSAPPSAPTPVPPVSTPSPARPAVPAHATPTRGRASSPSRATPTPRRATARTVTGGTADTPYGPVQIRIALTDGKITAVQPLQLPNDRERSVAIANYSVPQLVQETLAAQSAHIDTVSGATYTSEGYQASLQSALDRAGTR